MRLVRKLTAALILGMIALLSVYGYLDARREEAFLDAEVHRHQLALGRALALAVTDLLGRGGEEPARRLVEAADRDDPGVRIRWVWLDAPAGDASSPARGSERGVRRDVTMAPFVAPGGRAGALEVTESLELEDLHVQTSVQRVGLTTAALALLSGGLAALLGGMLVGRPVEALAGKARRIGEGDLGGPLELRPDDELGQLGREMNAMCDRLAESRDRLARETAERIAILEQLRHADRLTTIGKLASGIAHELGTPLNVVRGRGKLIATGQATGDEATRNGRVIVEQVDRMSAIIRQLLDFARGRRAEKASADLGALAAQTVSLLEPLAQKRGLTINLARPEEPEVAAVNAGQIQQALTNLIMNAIQASPRGAAVDVRIGHASREPGGDPGELVTLEVADRGTGIAAEHLPRIFEPFFTTKDVGEGTGLGLSVTFGIVQGHGGFLAVDSALERGSRFTIHLPRS